MHLRDLLPGFARHLAARAAAPRTIASYTRTVGAFFDALGDEPVSHGGVEQFLSRVGTHGRPLGASTKRGELMALRAFFRFASREAAVVDPTDGIVVKRERRPAAAVVMPDEIGPMFEAAARSSEPRRDSLVVALLFVLGLRLHEVVTLDVAQVDLDARVLRRVRGKGGVVSSFPLPERLAAFAAAWLRVRALHGHDEGPLFPTRRPSSSRTGRLSLRSVQRIVARLARDAGLGRAIGPHALRHGCATAAISLGIDVPTTAAVMRHVNISTTNTYTHIANDDRRVPLERLAQLIPAATVPTSERLRSPAPVDRAAPAGGQDAPENKGLDVHPL